MTGPDNPPPSRWREARRDRRIVGTVRSENPELVPHGLIVATAYVWRMLVLAAGLGVLVWLVIQLKLLVVPLLIAILVTALVWPAFSFMLRHRVPRWAAIAVTVIGAAAIVAGLLALVVWQVTQQWASVQERTLQAIDNMRTVLATGPLHVTDAQIDGVITQVVDFIQQQAQVLWTGALAIGATVGHIATGAVLALFVLLCLLADGAGIWRWTTNLFPRRARPAVDGAGRAGWRTVVDYARTQLLVATIDAIGIAAGAALLGVPLAVPIGVLVFLGAFIPIVGAVLTGTVAVFLALVYNGWFIALWMLVVVLGVQQLEGHVLQPLLMGSAVKVHPLAVVLVVAGGAMIAGIPGALFAVPMAAFVNVVGVYLSERAWETGQDLRGADLIWSTVPRLKKGDE
ncbi:permease [Microbacterium mangrovi]|uniref:Permease n=1 Tax=Microbacterium mangrovi TaxID=1348253 RepID=A0A0B2A9N9_9MICO|nr:AI-2E family transporter [Microbacterium mangrovi]KHK98473.1 permease [Microbacterium mangrovi]